MVDKTCSNCETVFPTSMPVKQDYCCPKCRKEAQKKRIDGVTASISAERTTYLAERFAAFEKDEFKCVYCGRGVSKSVKLDTMNDGKGGLKTVCEECKVGKGDVE